MNSGPQNEKGTWARHPIHPGGPEPMAQRDDAQEKLRHAQTWSSSREQKMTRAADKEEEIRRPL